MAGPQTVHRRSGESGLVQRVRARLAALPIAGVPSLVVGVSGGVDSLALAGVLAELARQEVVTVVAVHVDHRLRPESGDEQVKVAEQVRALGIEFVAEQLAPNVRERHPGVGLEEAARRERFAALANVARRRGVDAIALAHHEMDQAETVLLHLLRGAGPHGVSGMAEWSVRPVPWWETEPGDESADPVAIWRPLITEPKAGLESFVSGLGLRPIVDPSNVSAEFRRNRIRHELLPLFEEISPGSAAAIVRYSQLAAAEDSYLASVVDAQLGSLVDREGQLIAGRFVNLDVVLQRRIVQAWLQSKLPAGVEVGQQRIDAVRALGLLGQGGNKIQIGSGWQVLRSRGLLRVERRSETKPMSSGARG